MTTTINAQIIIRCEDPCCTCPHDRFPLGECRCICHDVAVAEYEAERRYDDEQEGDEYDDDRDYLILWA